MVGFTAEVLKGFGGRESLVEIEPEPGYDSIEITLEQKPQHGRPVSVRSILVSHDEARQIIGGLASVIQ